MDNAEWFLNEARSLRDSLTAAHKAGEEVRRQLAEAVKLLERLRHSDESNWRERFEETDAFLAKVHP